MGHRSQLDTRGERLQRGVSPVKLSLHCYHGKVENTRRVRVHDRTVISRHEGRQTSDRLPSSETRSGSDHPESPSPAPTNVDLNENDCDSTTSQGLPLVFFLPCKKSPLSLFTGQRVPTPGVYLASYSTRCTRRSENHLSTWKVCQHPGYWHAPRRTQKRRKRFRKRREG